MDTEQENIEQNEQDEAALRAEIAGEVFSGKSDAADTQPEPENQPAEVQGAKAETETEVDPWAGVNPALKDQFTSMAARVKDFDKIAFQLKQAERRIGSLQNEFHQAKQAAKQAESAPTPAEVAAAEGSRKAWEELKEEYPEWGRALDGRLAAQSAEVVKQIKAEIPDLAALRSETDGKQSQLLQRLEIAERKAEIAMIKAVHQDYEKVLASTDYAAWVAKQTDDYKAFISNAATADDATAIISRFKEATAKPQKSAGDIAAARQQRLKQAQSFSGRPPTPVKSEADMTEAELRRSVAAEVWKKG